MVEDLVGHMLARGALTSRGAKTIEVGPSFAHAGAHRHHEIVEIGAIFAQSLTAANRLLERVHWEAITAIFSHVLRALSGW